MNRLAAIHDAGHAVALSLLGFTDFVVADSSPSFTLTAAPPAGRAGRVIVARGVAVAAGVAAEVCWRRHGQPLLRGEIAALPDDAFEVDVDDLHSIAGGALDKHWSLLTSIGQSLLLPRWHAVEAVAAALRRRRRLTAAEVAAVLRRGTATLEHAEPDRTARVAAPLEGGSRSPRRRATARA